MCGNFGIVTENQEISVAKVVIEGIKRLEFLRYLQESDLVFHKP